MPAPPPPPPLAPGAPPPPTSMFKTSNNSKSSPNDVNALLKSIQKGTKLKKAVTNDRSAPILGGSSNKSSNGGIGAMPLLSLPTGGAGGPGSLRNGSACRSGSGGISPVSPMSSLKNFGSIQMELRKQLANDNRNRGPPPPTPTRQVPPDSGGRHLLGQKENINGFHKSQLSLHSNSSYNNHVTANQSTLHRKAKSNANLSTLDAPDASVSKPNKLMISHGKPNLAPKPPVLNDKPRSLQLKIARPVTRTHSLKSPRSPSPQSPEINTVNKFGTVRHISSIIGQSLANSSAHNARSRPVPSSRPSAPPPSIPVPQTPNHQSSSSHTSIQAKVNMVKPNHAPPPPPTYPVPQAPSHAPPPPPPHKTQLNKPFVSATVSNPPSPPPRNSSMRDTGNVGNRGTNLEDRFKHLFRSQNEFPSPPPYKNVIKLYNSVSVKPAPVKPVPVA